MQNQLKEQTRSDPDLLTWVYQIQALSARAQRVKHRLPTKLFDPQFGGPEKYVFANVYLKQLDRLFTVAQDEIILLRSSIADGESRGELTTGFATRAHTLTGICVDILGDAYQNQEFLGLIQVKYDLDIELAKLVAKQAQESIEAFSQVLGRSVDIVLSAVKNDLAHLVYLIEIFVAQIEKSVA
jgi:hypothetical protein